MTPIMPPVQAGILAPLPAHARYLFFRLRNVADARNTLCQLAAQVDGTQVVAGLGASLTAALDHPIDGLDVFPAMAGPGVDVPSTQTALWLWLRHDERGFLVHKARSLQALLAPAFELVESRDGVYYREGHDLTGYEDGTENPTGKAITGIACINGRGPGENGASFVAVQLWEHDLDAFQAMPHREQDHLIGRRRSDNAELGDAPESAHVKRTAQEEFSPEAFVWRRSMPWVGETRAGFMFVAFAGSFYAFNAQMRRMAGLDDGITDGLFRISRPVSGGYYWCPPMREGHLDLSALGIRD
jgi:putative iron-dependent peroxidase